MVLTGIQDKAIKFNFLSSPSSFFKYAVNYTGDINGVSNAGVSIDSHVLSADHKLLIINCHAIERVALSFKIKIEIPEGSHQAIISTAIKNEGNSKLFVKLLIPDITDLTVPGYDTDPYRMLGMIPQEIGGVTTLANGVTMGNAGDKLEELSQQISQLPGAFNVMEVADMYDKEGHGGVFFLQTWTEIFRGILSPFNSYCLNVKYVVFGRNLSGLVTKWPYQD